MLDKHGALADKTGNSYAAWRQITPDHNALVDAMLQSPCHIIATVRSKTVYAQEKDEKNRTVVKKIGMAPVFRDGIEYEFTVFMDIDQNHVATATKDRTRLFDGQYFKINEQTGEKLLEWLNSGKAEPEPPAEKPGLGEAETSAFMKSITDSQDDC